MNDFDNAIEERIQVMEDGEVVNTISCTQWFAENVYPGPGNWIVEPAVPAPVVPTPVPESIPMLNARLALIDAGHMAAVTAYVDGLTGPDGEQARAYWHYALSVRRDHALVEGLRTALDLTAGDIDALFIAAAALA